MTERYCNSCKEYKSLEYFKQYGHECADCKKEHRANSTKRYYTNRYRCECGLYISDGNPKEKHVKTQSHINWLMYGDRSPKSDEFLLQQGTQEQIDNRTHGIIMCKAINEYKKQNDTWTCSCGYSCAYKYKDKHKLDSKCHWWWLNQSITKPLTIKFKQLWRHHIEEFDKYSSKAEDIFKTYSQRHQSNSNEEEGLEKEFQKQFP